MKTHAYLRIILCLGACALAPPAGAGVRQGRAPADCGARKVPQLTDVTARAGIRFTHTSAPDKKYIVESMSGGVLLIDFDRDGWLDIYLTNAPRSRWLSRGRRRAAHSTGTTATALSRT